MTDARPTFCGSCAELNRHTPTTTMVIHTTEGPVSITVCPLCDRRRCKKCSRIDRSGTAMRCEGCGDSLRLAAM